MYPEDIPQDPPDWWILACVAVMVTIAVLSALGIWHVVRLFI